MSAIDDAALDQLFREARSFSHWRSEEVSDDLLQALYELMKWGPTAANASPARLLFIRSREGKERLRPCLAPGNVEKSMSAPVVAVVAMDLEFYEELPTLFPHTDARSWYVGNEAAIRSTAFRNSSLQGAYLMLAARALGLDCGPMSGFDGEKLNAEFFPDGKVEANFICALGYGERAKLHPRGPRLSFERACALV